MNSDENVDNKKLKVTEASNPKTRETNTLIHKPYSQNVRDFKYLKMKTCISKKFQVIALNPTNKNLPSPSNSSKKDK